MEDEDDDGEWRMENGGCRMDDGWRMRGWRMGWGMKNE
jgi:hypothetical protein